MGIAETAAHKPAFGKDRGNELFPLLRKEVNKKVEELAPHRRFWISVKAVVFPLSYFAVFAAALIWGSQPGVFYFSYMMLGLLLVINFLNLIHEAVHNTLFRNKTLNSLYIYFFDLMGANSFIWKVRHIRLHHNYPNVIGWDSDFEQSPIARVFPSGAFRDIHRYQHIYLPLVYPLYLFNWLLVRDFKDFFNRSKLVWKVTDIPRSEFVKLFLFKGFFLFYLLVLPKLLLPLSWGQVLLGFAVLMFSASLLSLVVLLSPHANTESEFPEADHAGNIETSWLMHQLCTTNDVQEDNWFTRFFMGCFNFHIAHHLFPSVNHVYYPEISEVIQDFAVRHELPYRRMPLRKSLGNHYKLLKINSVHENIFEETM